MCGLLISGVSYSQLFLKVMDERGVAVSGVEVRYASGVYTTGEDGSLRIPLSEQKEDLRISKAGRQGFTRSILPRPSVQRLNVVLVKQGDAREIQEVSFRRYARPSRTYDLTSREVSAQQARDLVSISGGVEDLIKSLPSVNSNTELSSQYMVRGGSYDENLIYINDIEVYRPMMVRNAMQEGLSAVNPDMVSTINFSAGGFEARYGDKMSSALNIYYRQPEHPEVSGELSLIGGRLTAGFGNKAKTFSGILGARYRNTNLILKTLGEGTDFNPQYRDIQTYLTWRIRPEVSMSFLGFVSQNDFEMFPHHREVNFGSLNNATTVNLGYNGQERDQYRNLMGTLSLQYRPIKEWKMYVDFFGYQNREKEYYSIASGYRVQPAEDLVTGELQSKYEVGGQIDHARNDLLVRTLGGQVRGQYIPDVNTQYEIGIKYESEKIQDLTNEWQLLDYDGYSLPKDWTNPTLGDNRDLRLKYAIVGNNNLQAQRISGFVQGNKKFYWGENRIFVNAGLRGQHWSFTSETLISPRMQFALKPNWDMDMLFRLSGGVYYQAPFYREIKALDGSFIPSIRAQRSLQMILGNEYEFEMYERSFKLTTEVYYKKMDRLIPYFVDNVRIRYTGNNNSQGYAYGVDTRLFGNFVPGVDSWISLSYARVMENIEGKGYIPRPTDQRLRFTMFYQDYMPRFPSMRIHLNMVYAQGLPNGAALFSDPYQLQSNLPAYRRLDIGLTKVFIDQKENRTDAAFWKNFQELSLGVQVFNAFNINNTISNQWITDVASNRVYPVPVRLTGRFFNIKLNFKF